MNSTCELGDDAARALEPYQDYKDSGVPWFGEVPKHWEVRRLKSWLDVNEFVLSEDTDPEYTFEYLDIGSVATGRLTAKPERIRFGNSPSRARRVVRPGDTIVSTVRTYLKAVWHAEHQGDDLVASTGFTVLTPRRGTFPRFVSYFCQSDPFTNRVTAEAVGIAYPAIAETRLGTFEVCIPPYPEQAAIVRFLDHADRRIRRYIRAQQQLIALLEEQKQAIINQAVTGQIDVRTGKPYQAYKPSGVEWLGDVPAHWEIGRLKVKLRPIDCRSSSGTETLLSLRRDLGVVVYAEHFSRPPQGASLVGYKLVETGQLVVNRLQANNGLLFCSRLSGVVSPDYSVFTARSPVDMEYLGSLLRTITYKAHFRRESTGLGTGSAGFLRLYDDRLLETPVALPPLEDQRTLLVSLNEVTASLCRAIDRQHVGVALLREYRTRLIADVVTGKLDVREAAARLQDEAEELEPLDEADALDGEEEPTDALATAP